MAWLRLDDTFLDHPKIIGLTDRDLRTWLTILLYAARYRTGGHIPKPAHRALTLTPARVTLYTQAGLLDRDHVDELHIHDWARYNPADPTGADRMRRQRETVPRPAAGRWAQTRAAVLARDHGICADCGKDCLAADHGDGRNVWNADHEPPRDQLEAHGISIYDLAYIVTRCHSCHAKKTRAQANQERTPHEPGANPAVTVRSPRAQAGARVPSPTPREREREPSVPSVSTKTPRARTGRTDGRNLTDLTRAATPNPIP